MDDNKVAILIEDLMSKFRTFGEGLDGFREEMNHRFDKLGKKLDAHLEQNRSEFEQNRYEHQQLMQMIKKIDKEVRVEIKRVTSEVV
jgi:Sec-independent protein translocase protein TatA